MPNTLVNFLFHLGTVPGDVRVVCGDPLPGQERATEPGIFNPGAAYTATAWASAFVVVVAVLFCYMWLGRRSSLGPRFSTRWWVTCAVACTLCALLVPAILSTQTFAVVGCPQPMSVKLDMQPYVLSRAVAGFFWGGIAFFLLSAALTRWLPKRAALGGFFHHRGCPWPRFIPGVE